MQAIPVPASLRGIKNPPQTLYAIGRPELLDARKIAIIGTRRPQAYTKEWTYKLASAVAAAGGVVVSGAAMGVDAIAHQGAGERTIAVMGNGLDILYPKVNQKLIREIYARGLALSEYEAGYEARPYSFVLRNRIVVGLSEAVVITQADLESGSMTSARLALEMGKPLYVLPHRLGESDGTNRLLAEGKAKAIHDPGVFLEAVGFAPTAQAGDPVLEYLRANPDYHAALEAFGGTLYEYELEGKIAVKNNRVTVL
jgi:DNA processing protein